MIEVDKSEPSDIIRLLEPAVDVDLVALNIDRWADYRWSGEAISHWPNHDGTYHVERKTWQDMVGGVEDIENQLREQYQMHPKAMLRLIIEGAVEPHPTGVYVYQRAKGRDVMVPRKEGHNGQYAAIWGKVAGWYEFMDVFQTASYPATAGLLVELYKRDQKPEDDRETFRKHYKVMTWHPNVQVMRLLGVAGRDTNIGVEKAEAIIAKFGTMWAAINASPEELAQVRGISVGGAKFFLQKIGRLDV